jgi:glucan 1,3-beta-glucosidase
LDLCADYGVKVLLDVHSLKDSQNGFDNSGKATGFEWVDENHFKHWSVQDARWMGHWNGTEYDWINQDNIDWAVENVRLLMEMWGNHPAVYALQPVNEPWENTDLPTLKDFYRTTRRVM